jgi:hypothetical protein
VVRAPINLLDHHTPGQAAIPDAFNLHGLLGFLSASAHELDGLIREIVNKTEQVKEQPE